MTITLACKSIHRQLVSIGDLRAIFECLSFCLGNRPFFEMTSGDLCLRALALQSCDFSSKMDCTWKFPFSKVDKDIKSWPNIGEYIQKLLNAAEDYRIQPVDYRMQPKITKYNRRLQLTTIRKTIPFIQIGVGIVTALPNAIQVKIARVHIRRIASLAHQFLNSFLKKYFVYTFLWGCRRGLWRNRRNAILHCGRKRKEASVTLAHHVVIAPPPPPPPVVSSVARLSIGMHRLTTPPRWDASPSQGTQHEATRSITTRRALDGILVHHRVPSMKQLEVLLLPVPWMGC